jgi:glycosyltransferase involved in cell wall biosynthesis
MIPRNLRPMGNLRPPPAAAGYESTTTAVTSGHAERRAMSLTVFINAGPWLPIPPSGYGGVENMLMYLIRELQERHQYRVILGTVGDSRIRVDRRIRRFQEGQHRHIAAPYCDAVSIAHAHMEQVVETIRSMPEIDIVHDFLEIVGPSMLKQLGSDGPPVLHTLQWNLTSHREYYRHFDGRGRVFFNGISGPQMRAATKKLSRQSLGVVHNGVDVEDFTYCAKKDEYVIMLARFTHDKGQDIAARVCSELNLPLRMAGTVGGIDSPNLLLKELEDPASPLHDYRDVKYYLQAVRPHERDDSRIAWVGGVGGDEKRNLVASARALLMPIRWEEPFGMAVIEALASGTPVVAMNRGAMEVIIKDGYNGFLVDDEQQFKDRLRWVADIDPANCRDSVLKRFSATDMAMRYTELYAQVIERAKVVRGRVTMHPDSNGAGGARATGARDGISASVPFPVISTRQRRGMP